MKRFHLHMGVEDLDESIRFYTALFGIPPVKAKSDYAKWMLEDPRINFAISTRAKKGVDLFLSLLDGHPTKTRLGVFAVLAIPADHEELPLADHSPTPAKVVNCLAVFD